MIFNKIFEEIKFVIDKLEPNSKDKQIKTNDKNILGNNEDGKIIKDTNSDTSMKIFNRVMDLINENKVIDKLGEQNISNCIKDLVTQLHPQLKQNSGQNKINLLLINPNPLIIDNNLINEILIELSKEEQFEIIDNTFINKEDFSNFTQSVILKMKNEFKVDFIIVETSEVIGEQLNIYLKAYNTENANIVGGAKTSIKITEQIKKQVNE